MTRHRWPVAALCALAAGLCARPAAAQVLLVNANFDTATPTYSYGYTYQQTGSSSQTNGVAAGTGVGGSNAYRVIADFTNAVGSQFSGVGGGSGQVPIPTPLVFPTGLGQFTYTFAASASGFTAGGPATTGTNLELTLLAPDNTVLPGDPDTDGDVILRAEINPGPSYNTAGGFQTFAGNFGTANVTAGSLAQLQTYFASVNQAQLNINFNGGNDFGFDAGNTLVFDNLQIAQVPEPSALALTALGVGAWIRRRRRV